MRGILEPINREGVWASTTPHNTTILHFRLCVSNSRRVCNFLRAKITSSEFYPRGDRGVGLEVPNHVKILFVSFLSFSSFV